MVSFLMLEACEKENKEETAEKQLIKNIPTKKSSELLEDLKVFGTNIDTFGDYDAQIVEALSRRKVSVPKNIKEIYDKFMLNKLKGF